MKKQLFIGLILVLLTGCVPVATTSTPTPIPTNTPIPPTSTAAPTPMVETGPNGTTVKTDYLGNFYAVDGEGKATHWYNTETNKYEPFQPIDFTKSPLDRPVLRPIDVSSGWYAQEINRAIAEGLWEPESPDVNYIKKPTAPVGSEEWLEQSSFLWWQELKFDGSGRKFLKILTDSSNNKYTFDKYPLQPTSFVSLYNDGKTDFSLSTVMLYYETSDGTRIQQPITFKTSREEDGTEADVELWRGLQFDPNFPPMSLSPLIEFDSNQVDLVALRKLRDGGEFTPPNPAAYDSFLRYFSYYENDAKDTDYLIRQNLLLRLYAGDESVFEELGKYLFSPVILGL